MRIKAILSKILAVIGTALIWLTVISPLLGLLIFLNRRPGYQGPPHFDYLLPAELFPVALLGGILLIPAELLAALKGRLHRRLIFWGLIAAVALLVGGQLLAVVTGLASGETEPTGLWWGLVLATLAGYVLGLAAVGTGGALLLRDLVRPPHAAAPRSASTEV